MTSGHRDTRKILRNAAFAACLLGALAAAPVASADAGGDGAAIFGELDCRPVVTYSPQTGADVRIKCQKAVSARV